MHIPRKAILGGAAALAVTTLCGLAVAKDSSLHTMAVQAPGGGTITIRYSGDIAPKVAFGPAADLTSFNSPFAMMDRMAARMDRDMAQMMSQADAMMAEMPDANPVYPADLHNMPLFGMPSLSAIAAGGKGSFCMKSMEITSTGDGKSPHVVTHQAGNCNSPAQAQPSVHATGPRTPI